MTSCVIDGDRRSPADLEVEARACAEQAAGAQDLKPLRAIRDRPDLATSNDHLRVLLGIKKNAVTESLDRCVRQRWVLLPGKQREPYQLTPDGLAVLLEGDL